MKIDRDLTPEAVLGELGQRLARRRLDLDLVLYAVAYNVGFGYSPGYWQPQTGSAAHKIGTLLDTRRQQQMQIGGIDIGVTDHTFSGQVGKGGGQAGFARSSLAADHNYFLHPLFLYQQVAQMRIFS